MSHLGRPTGDAAKDAILKMDRVAARFGELLGRPVHKAGMWSSARRSPPPSQALKPGEVLLLENLRFDPGEQKNDPEFAGQIAALGDVYVNDAFGTCHTQGRLDGRRAGGDEGRPSRARSACSSPRNWKSSTA